MHRLDGGLGRRAFLKLSGAAAVGSWLSVGASMDSTQVLRIRKGSVGLAPDRCITTTTYDGQVPGPLLRGVVGQALHIDIYNEPDASERINWHGLRHPPGDALIHARSRHRL